MKLNFVKYLIIVLLLTCCRNQETKIRGYGFPKNENRRLNVSLELSEFKNYGILIDRIREITCNDSIPKIVVKQKNLILNIYPTELCEPIIFDPDGKHYVTFRKGKPFEWQTITEIFPDSLSKKLTEDFSYYRNSEKLESYLIIIESERNEKINGIEKFITGITQEYDKLETKLELNFAFWEDFQRPPPPPAFENE
tara:strand:- start:2092 stop:2679 length:588 start_codon:yes stop_codon:yes gene_type:complete